MEYIARNARSAGGDIVFATAVGDIWQHGSKPIDAKHAAMGQKSISNPVFGAYLNPEPKTLSVEMPTARAGYSILSGKLPFSVVPGNHDYDSVWRSEEHTSELQSLMRISYAVFCLKKKNRQTKKN